MSGLSRALSRAGGRQVVLALGGLYVVLAAAWPFVLVADDPSIGEIIVLAVLVGGPGLGLLVRGARLPETDIHPRFYGTIARWCLGAVGVVLGLLALIEVAAGLRDPVQNVLILTALASVAGLAAGNYDARAKTRTHELEQRNRELQRTKAELEETVAELQTSNERLEQFAYAASHDLQEPLRMVSSYLQLLERRYRDELDDDAREYIDFAVGGADRMRAMVGSLLEYSRISTRGEPLAPTDAGDALDDVLEDLHLRIEETNATVTADDLPTVLADPDQLAQVFRHLVSNALQFSGDDSPRVHVSAEPADGDWRFAVADEGIGIDPEFHDRVFTVFENLQSGGPDEERGAGGIGLALCERIVERHGGDIWVESAPGEGATFYFTVPGVETDPADVDGVGPDEGLSASQGQ